VLHGRPAVLGLVRRLAEAALVKCDTSVTGTELLDHVLPAASIVDAGMNQQDIGTVLNTRALVRELGTSGGREHPTQPTDGPQLVQWADLAGIDKGANRAHPRVGRFGSFFSKRRDSLRVKAGVSSVLPETTAAAS